MMAGAELVAESPPRWRLETPAVTAIVELHDGGLCLASLVDAGSGEAWRGLVGQPLTRLWIAGDRASLAGWRLRSWRVNEEERAVRLGVELAGGTGAAPLALTATVWLASDLPVLRHWVELRNEGERPIELARQLLLDLALDHDVAAAPLDLFFVDAFAGHRKDRWEPGDANFACHERRLGPSDAVRLGVGAYQPQCAWLALRRPDGGGLAVGLEYDGAAVLRLFDASRTAGANVWGGDGAAGVRLVAAPAEPINVRVAPGGSWQSPAVICGAFAGDWDEAAGVTHALVEGHLAPAWPDDAFPYVIFNSWGYAWDLTPERMLRCLDVAAEIGVEVFVADYGWARAVGDWVPVATRMPLLGDLGRLVRARGMRFGAWMGFANADPGAPVLREHPDWRTHPDDWGSFGSRALCLAEPAAREWVTAEVVRVVGEYDLDYLVHDFEPITPCTHPGHHHPPDPGGYHSAAGFGEVLRRVRDAHPRLVIENCEGGGRIMTYAMVGTHDTSITSDGPVLRNALARRQALYGATYPFPLRFCDNYMEEPPIDDACHSSMIGGPWILMDRPTEWGAAEVETARRNIALYKEVRRLYRGGRVYHLRRPDGADWDGLQVHHPATDRGALFLFQPPGSAGTEVSPRLRGLSPDRRYRLRPSGEAAALVETGATLLRGGWRRSLLPGSSEVILIEPAEDG